MDHLQPFDASYRSIAAIRFRWPLELNGFAKYNVACPGDQAWRISI
jgi:hypothetical protein